jgi:hypothetical protein
LLPVCCPGAPASIEEATLGRPPFAHVNGLGPPVLFFIGFADPLDVARASGLARALSGGFRLVFADDRGQVAASGHGNDRVRVGDGGWRKLSQS